MYTPLSFIVLQTANLIYYIYILHFLESRVSLKISNSGKTGAKREDLLKTPYILRLSTYLEFLIHHLNKMSCKSLNTKKSSVNFKLLGKKNHWGTHISQTAITEKTNY